MQKLPAFDSAKYELNCLGTMTAKNIAAIQSIEACLNVVIEAINELIDKDPSIDLKLFKDTLLKELATLLNQNSEFEFSNSLFDLLGTERTDLKNCFSSLELQVQALTERVSRIESELALGHEKKQGKYKASSF